MKIDDLTDTMKKAIIEGFVYQRFQCACGFSGNGYHKIDEKWTKRTHCPQCDVEIVYVSLPFAASTFAQDARSQTKRHFLPAKV